ncbi:MAG TPA: ABC transporter substrate-binding protein [Burkholderiaceae bacterium]|nr:ABC transporter substrate-binding protein [Burkholderiaceae bacterium]
MFNRRRFLSAIATTSLGGLAIPRVGFSQTGGASTLTIAYNVAPASLDPNSGPSAVSPGLQSIFRSLYDPYFVQREDLSLAPGVIEDFGWNAQKTRIRMRLRQGVTWHDGKPVAIQDIEWNLKRLGDKAGGSPLQAIFASNKNYAIEGNELSFDVDPWRANMLERLTFLGCYLLPPHHYQAVGKEGFERQPIGCGPYMFDQYERGSFLRLKAYPNYWGGKAAFDTVVFKFVTDPASRVAEIERGSSDVTLDVPYEEYDRLRTRPGLVGHATPVTDIAMIFLNNVGVMSDPNVRKAAVHAIDKNLIVERLHRGYAKPIDTLLAPQYGAYDESIRTPYDPKLAAELLAKSGYSRDKPIEFTIQTTRGYKPKDYETVQAIVEMWRRVGIRANIEVYEIAKHFELRTQHKLAPAAFYNWGNSTADPESSLGTALMSTSPHSSWKGGDIDADLKALFVERDQAKRMEGYKRVNRIVAENALVLPLFQFYQPVLHKAELKFTPHLAGYVLPYAFSRAGKG